MDKLSRLLDLARTKPLSDIVVPGYTSDDMPGPRYFTPRLTRIYLDFKGSLVKLASARNFSAIALEFPDQIERDFDMDEDDVFATCSLSEMYFSVPYEENRVKRIEAFFLAEDTPEDGVFASFGIGLAQGDFLFFDPSNFWGTRIGGSALRDSWIASSMLPGAQYRVAGWDVTS